MYQANLQPQITRTDSSFVSDQHLNEYVIKNQEKTQVENHDNFIRDDSTTKEEGMITPPPCEGDENRRIRKPLKHYLCCICCPCLPMWTRYGCCTLLILFVIFLIIVGVLAAIFKIPVVDFNGPTRHPEGLESFEKSNNTLAFSVNFGLKFGVINDNVESITFESIKTIAYYPTAPQMPVGGGEIYNVYIGAYGISNFTFPFSIKYDPVKDEGFAMLSDIITKCGLVGGSEQEDLFINYDLIPTVRIAGIAISPIIHQSSHFPCPISSGQLSMGLLSNSSYEDEKDEEDDE